SRASSSRKSATSSNARYTAAKRTYAAWSSLRSPAITSSPTGRLAISRSVVMRSWCTTARTAASICSSDTGRFCSARSKPWRSLRASNWSRRPSLLMIAGSFSSIVSRVLKRSPQASHSRRRRMVAPSSLTRESMTRVSACWQKGQCIGRRLRSGSAVDRELAALRGDRFPHLRDHVAVVRVVEHVAEPVGELDAVLFLVAAGGDRRGADAQAGGDERLLRVVGHRVLVDGDVGLAERGFRVLSSDALADHVHQHQVVLRTAG